MVSLLGEIIHFREEEGRPGGPPHLPGYGGLVYYFDAEGFEGYYFAGVIGEETDGVEAEVGQDLGADAVLVLEEALAGFALVMHEVAAVGRHARLAVGGLLDTEAGAGFVEVDQDAKAFLGDGA